jgi:membrane-associated protein
MENAFSVFTDLFNPEMLIRYGGLTLLLVIIFAETGLFFGFFLPGDSLLFMAGLLSNSSYLQQPVYVVVASIITAAVAGTCVGYWFGRVTNEKLKLKKENWFYKKRYLDIAADFYTRYGMLAFIVGRFLPIVRTFVPILSGMVRIPFGSFLLYNFIGAVCWVGSMVFGGYLLGNAFPGLVEHVEFIVIGLVIVTAIPVVLTYRKHHASFLAADVKTDQVRTGPSSSTERGTDVKETK